MLDADIGDNWLDHTICESVEIADVALGEAFLDAFKPLLSLACIVETERYGVTISDKDAARAIPAIAHRGTRTVTSQSVGALVSVARERPTSAESLCS